ncbi:unnamed protein product [Ceratitis capitata]|uniref:(Mediterranean fruit fly) hypothetical protein n=1 Tax=Ceratitis capitata TaxID=7213 RepID=A0A811VCS9_CERCA|nr:unnamed protein product [Ceratitis capitata]
MSELSCTNSAPNCVTIDRWIDSWIQRWMTGCLHWYAGCNKPNNSNNNSNNSKNNNNNNVVQHFSIYLQNWQLVEKAQNIQTIGTTTPKKQSKVKISSEMCLKGNVNDELKRSDCEA